MPAYRCTFFFKDDNEYGWSETYYSTKATLNQVIIAAGLLVPLRVSCLGTGVALAYVRASDDLVKRDSLIIAVPARNGKNGSVAMGPSDIANTCLVVRLQANELTRRTLSMRGIPDGIVANSGEFTPTADFMGAFNAFIAGLVGNNWCIRKLNQPVTPPAVTSIAQNPVNGQVTITFNAPHGLVAGAPMILNGVHGPSNLNGQTTVFQVVSPTVVIVQSNVIAAPWTGGGTVKPVGYTLVQIASGQIIRASHRIAGRPFDSPRGRRRARARK